MPKVIRSSFRSTLLWQFLNQLKMQSKPIATCSHAFPPIWRLFHVSGLRSDWFIVLLHLLRLTTAVSLIVVVGHSVEEPIKGATSRGFHGFFGPN